MLDIHLAFSLLDACPTSNKPFKLVFVGDVEQLPSVGPGRVLGDLIDSRCFPVTRLTSIYRQEDGSGILLAASAIRAGRVPESGEVSGRPGFFLVPRIEVESVESALMKILKERLPGRGYQPLRDVQVLSPTRKGPLGTNRLNDILQDALNPDGEGVHWGSREFRVGDRVICQRNKHDIDVFNGDLGVVLSVSKAQLSIRFNGIVVPWERDDAQDLDLGYAITIHKSQGSEYPVVVALIHRSHSIMLYRNLIYTGFTRAREFLCAIGEPHALKRAIDRVNHSRRHTRLGARISEREHGDHLGDS